MNPTTLLRELKEDATLVLQPDSWLDSERERLATEIDRLTEELQLILLAKKAKNALQQRNMVAVQEFDRDENDNIVGETLVISSLPHALKKLKGKTSATDQAAVVAMLKSWQSDGYDLENSMALVK